MGKSILEVLFNPDNNFFKLGRSAKRLPHIGFSSILIPLLFIAGGALIYNGVFVTLILGGKANIPLQFRSPFSLTILFSFIILGVFAWVKLVEGRPFHTIGLTRENALKKYLFGFGTGFFMLASVVGLVALFGEVEIAKTSNSTTGLSALGFVALTLFGFIIQGGAEELTTRGWQFQVIGLRYKPWIGALVSSLFFAFLHGFNNSVSVLAVFNLFLFALLLVLYVMNDGSIWAACGWHSAWNWTMGNVFGLEVSGNNINATLFDFNLMGPDIITGGGFGPEGSIFTTVVLSTGIILVSIYIKKKYNNSLSK